MSLRQLFTGAAKPPKNQTLKKTPEKTPRTPSPLPLEEGLDHLRAGRFDHAVVALRLALQREPGRFAAVRGLVTAYVQTGETKPARRVMERFTVDHPMAGEGWRLAAQLEWKLGDRARAVELLYSGLKRLPHSHLLHRQLAVFLAAEGKLSDASAHVEATSPDEGGSMMQDYLAAAAGVCAKENVVLRGAKPQAVGEGDQDWVDQIVTDSALLNAILTPLIPEGSPLSPENRQMLLQIEWKLARLVEAQPHHADRQLLLARVQARLDVIPAAILSVQRALRANPNLIEAYRLRATLHARIGEGEQAIAILKQLLKRGLSWPDIHFEIAAIEQQCGRNAEARSHLYSAIHLNPRFHQARALLERCAA